jgi:hypothetical protein
MIDDIIIRGRAAELVRQAQTEKISSKRRAACFAVVFGAFLIGLGLGLAVPYQLTIGLQGPFVHQANAQPSAKP